MKTNIVLSTACALSAILATSAHAETRIINQGRAGFTIVHLADSQSTVGAPVRETNVALVMQKPDTSTTKVHTMGRAGYVVVPAGNRGR